MSRPEKAGFSVASGQPGQHSLCPPCPLCPHCQRHDAEPTPVARLSVGAFSVLCVDCCARLVRSARPLRGAQEAHMAAITRREGRPTRAQIIDAIKAQDAKWAAATLAGAQATKEAARKVLRGSE